MAVSGSGQSLDWATPLYLPEDPGFTGQSIDPGSPTGYVAPTAWAYNTFPNEAPILWERAWYRARTSTLGPALHSVLASVPVRITGAAAAPSVVPLVRSVDAGTTSGTVRVLSVASGAYGWAAKVSGTVIIKPGIVQIGGIADAPSGIGDIALAAAAAAFPATSLSASGALVGIGGAAEADTGAGGLAAGQVRLTGAADATRARLATGKAATVRLQGAATATVVPPMTANPGAVKITATAALSAVKSMAAVGSVKLASTATAASGPSVSATGSIALTAREAVVADTMPGQLILVGEATPAVICQAKATGKVRVLPISVAARQAGEPSATGTVRVHALVIQASETAALPGFISITGQADALRAPVIDTTGQVTLSAPAAEARVLAVAQADPAVIALTGIADADLQQGSGTAGSVAITGLADAATEPGHTASGGVLCTGLAEPHVVTMADGTARVDVHAIGIGDIPLPPRHEATGEAICTFLADGLGFVPIRTDAHAWIIMRAQGAGSRTIEPDGPQRAILTLRGYGSALPLRSVREKVAQHRADTWLADWRLTPAIHIRHSATQAFGLSWAITEMPITTRVTGDTALIPALSASTPEHQGEQ